jgi:hypothetical protein
MLRCATVSVNTTLHNTAGHSPPLDSTPNKQKQTQDSLQCNTCTSPQHNVQTWQCLVQLFDAPMAAAKSSSQ